MTSTARSTTPRRVLRRALGRLAASGVLVAGAGIASASAAGAQADGSSQPFVRIEPSTVALGGQLQVTGSCGPEGDGQQVPIVLGGLEGGQLGEVRTDPITGDFTTTVDVPGPPGATGEGQILVGCGLGSNRDPRAPITVVAAEQPDAGQPATAIGRGDTGELVAFWQARWNDWARIADVEFGPLTVDGVFGSRTERATRLFQETNDAVPVDGVVNPEDRVALREAIEAVQEGAPPIGRGDTGELVEFWQSRINDWLEATGTDLRPLAVDGIFGPRTEEATRLFQEASGAVPTDLVVHPEDRRALREAIEAARDAAPAIRRGDTGELVEFWQSRYNDWMAVTGASFGPLDVDGIFGPRTEQATRVFQEASEAVPTDLVVDPEDRVALREAIAAAGGAGSGDDEPVGDYEPLPTSTDDFPGSGEASQLTDVRIGDHGDFERIAFQFGGDDLEYRLEYVDQVTAPSGRPVEVEGEATLQVTVTPATAHDAEGNETFDPERIAVAATELVNEVKVAEDAENQLTFAVGLDRRVDVASAVLGDPARLVLDVPTS